MTPIIHTHTVSNGGIYVTKSHETCIYLTSVSTVHSRVKGRRLGDGTDNLRTHPRRCSHPLGPHRHARCRLDRCASTVLLCSNSLRYVCGSACLCGGCCWCTCRLCGGCCWCPLRHWCVQESGDPMHLLLQTGFEL